MRENKVCFDSVREELSMMGNPKFLLSLKDRVEDTNYYLLENIFIHKLPSF